MQKKVFTGVVALSLLLMAIGSAAASPWTSTAPTTNTVLTSAGSYVLASGTVFGGNPTNYVTILETVTITTSSGPQTLDNGTVIDCDVPPPLPEPCINVGS